MAPRIGVRPSRVATALLAAAALGACGGDGGTRPSPTPTPLTREQAVRDAVRITTAAQLEVMRSVRPGMREGDVKAIIERVFQREGADGTAFAHIAATGAHAVDAHWSGDDGVLADGDLLVVDIGASREGWASDLTRTVPVSGRFTSRQRELYALALEGQEHRGPVQPLPPRPLHDYWVGSTGLECLSCGLPRWPEEIETVMDAGRAGVRPHMQRRDQPAK